MAAIVISRDRDGRDGSDAGRREFEDSLARRCAEAGLQVVMVPHLYHAAEDDGVWSELRGLGARAVASWLYPRAMDWLLRRHGIEGATPLGMGLFACADDCLREVLSLAGGGSGQGGIREVPGGGAERWYPVIDAERCAGCGQCLQFCLFGVYELDAAGRPTAAQPDNCKPGCPACSRICPRGAIMFPLYKDEAIAGAPGRFMAPDPAAKAMFYARTRKPCPICGRRYESAAPRRKQPAGSVCRECGLPLEPPAQPSSRDDLDSLIDDLEKLR